MRSSKNKTPMKRSTRWSCKPKSLNKAKRFKPYCAACDSNFAHVQLFEQHIQSKEHKIMDSPRELILQRVEEVNRGNDVPEEYRKLAQQASRGESSGGEGGQPPNNIDISDLSIGAGCICRVQVFYCTLCKTYIGEEDPEPLMVHCSSFEHTQNQVLSELT